MVALDSCGCLAYFLNEPAASAFASYIESNEGVLVPVLVMYEVFKRIDDIAGTEAALLAVAMMRRHRLAELTVETAIAAAVLSKRHKLHMADSIILALANEHGVVLVTQDEHFAGLPKVQLIPRMG